MKQFLIVFCSIALISAITLLAYNSEEGVAKRTEGIADTPIHSDSLLKRGRQLVNKMNYSETDLDAIAAYLNKK